MAGKLIILQGLPASGKSTWAKEYQAAEPTTRVIVSRDSIRHSRGQYWVPKQEPYITRLEEVAVMTGLEMGYEVILDATNLNPEHLQKWSALASKYDATVEKVHFNTPVDVCIAQDMNPNRIHRVGSAVILSFYNKYKETIDSWE